MQDVTWYGLPYPISSPFLPYALTRLCGDATAKGFGFPSTIWTWSSFSQAQAHALLSFFDNMTDASKQLYIRTYKDDGAQRETADFYVVLYRPVDGDGKNLMPGSRFNYTGVSAKFGHMVEQ
jgi:hypothetical protein